MILDTARILIAVVEPMSEPSEQLDDHERQLWADYERYETAGLRKQALGSLRDFIAAIGRYPPERRRAWVEATRSMHWARPAFAFIEGALDLRHPLLVEVILPELLHGYREQRPRYARWIGLFSLTRTGGINATTYDELRPRGMPEWYPPDLLREALELDPSDEQAAHALIRHLEESFDYYTHHVPTPSSPMTPRSGDAS